MNRIINDDYILHDGFYRLGSIVSWENLILPIANYLLIFGQLGVYDESIKHDLNISKFLVPMGNALNPEYGGLNKDIAKRSSIILQALKDARNILTRNVDYQQMEKLLGVSLKKALVTELSKVPELGSKLVSETKNVITEFEKQRDLDKSEVSKLHYADKIFERTLRKKLDNMTKLKKDVMEKIDTLENLKGQDRAHFKSSVLSNALLVEYFGDETLSLQHIVFHTAIQELASYVQKVIRYINNCNNTNEINYESYEKFNAMMDSYKAYFWDAWDSFMFERDFGKIFDLYYVDVAMTRAENWRKNFPKYPFYDAEFEGYKHKITVSLKILGSATRGLSSLKYYKYRNSSATEENNNECSIDIIDKTHALILIDSASKIRSDYRSSIDRFRKLNKAEFDESAKKNTLNQIGHGFLPTLKLNGLKVLYRIKQQWSKLSLFTTKLRLLGECVSSKIAELIMDEAGMNVTSDMALDIRTFAFHRVIFNTVSIDLKLYEILTSRLTVDTVNSATNTVFNVPLQIHNWDLKIDDSGLSEVLKKATAVRDQVLRIARINQLQQSLYINKEIAELNATAMSKP